MFITFEGPEGSGKSTQAQALHRHLVETGLAVVLTREPGGTALGDSLRRLLMDAVDVPIDPRAETLLFAAARAQLVAEVIAPALAAGKVVICDRYSDSTIAYQAYGRGLEPHAVRRVVDFATGGLQPDLSVLLDLPPEDGLKRKKAEPVDRFERETLDFHRRVREGYLSLAGQSPERWLVVDGTLPERSAFALICTRVEALLGRRGRTTGVA